MTGEPRADARGGVSFEADGARYTLRFSTAAMIAIEDALDCSFGDVAKQIDGGSFRTIREVVYQGLVAGGHEVTLDKAAAIMDAVGIARCGEIIAAALLALQAPEKTGSGRAGKNPTRRPARKAAS